MTARMHSTPQGPFPFSQPVSSSPLSPTSLPFGPASGTRKSAWLSYTAYTLLGHPPWFSSAQPLTRTPHQPLCLSLSFSHSRPYLPCSSLGFDPSFRPRAFQPPPPVAPPYPPCPPVPPPRRQPALPVEPCRPTPEHLKHLVPFFPPCPFPASPCQLVPIAQGTVPYSYTPVNTPSGHATPKKCNPPEVDVQGARGG